MDRVFLDANVLFSAAYSRDSGLIELWKLDVELITSSYALEEARANIETRERHERLNHLIKNVLVIPTQTDWELPEDFELAEKDRPILAAAVAAKAGYLITGDFTHFGKYFGTKVFGVVILPPADCLRLHK